MKNNIIFVLYVNVLKGSSFSSIIFKKNIECDFFISINSTIINEDKEWIVKNSCVNLDNTCETRCEKIIIFTGDDIQEFIKEKIENGWELDN